MNTTTHKYFLNISTDDALPNFEHNKILEKYIKHHKYV